MSGAFFAGLVAASSLLVGAAIVLVRPVSERTLGLIMAFGSGVLISAVAYDLILEAASISGGVGIPLGAAAGAFAYFLGDRALDRAGAGDRKSVTASSDGDPKAVVLGTVLDGIPESIVLGLTLLSGEGLSIAFFAAVFLSNLPEAMAATTGLASAGIKPPRIILMWVLIAVVSGAAAFAGYWLFGSASSWLVAFVMALAAGAVITMLADTMMPEAFKYRGRITGLVTTLGFVVALAIASLEQRG
jgi:zinc transporter, ZIP family